jgi:hypothetical protein
MFEVHLYLPLKIKTIILVATNKKVKLNKDVFVRTEGLDTVDIFTQCLNTSDPNLLLMFPQ